MTASAMPTRPLIAVAARVEWQAVCQGLAQRAPWPDRPWQPVDLGSCDAVLTGVGKANAAAGIALACDPQRHAAIISLGIAGSLPTGGPMLPVGSLVLATDSVYADEGVRTPTGFQSLADMGFPPDDPLAGPPSSQDRADRATPHADARFHAACDLLSDRLHAALERHALPHARGVVATVSICSGTDALAREVADRTGAIVEAMEGAAGRFAALHLSRRLGRPLPFAELRVVSNNTGDYDQQVWRIADALAVVRLAARAIAEAAADSATHTPRPG